MAFKDWFKDNSAGIPGFQWAKDINAQKDSKKEQEKVNAANKRLADAMGLAGQQYMEQRPFQSAARQEGLRNQLGLYSPANDMMREMSGGRYALDLNAPVERYPSPYDMQLASQQSANPNYGALTGPPQGGAPGWGGVGGKVMAQSPQSQQWNQAMATNPFAGGRR